GKSTLIKIIGGVLRPDEGKILINGKAVVFKEPRDAERQGIVVLHQDPRLCPDLSVVENVLLGHLPTHLGWVDWKAAEEKTRDLLRRLAVTLPLDLPVSHLTAAQRQLVVLARALSIKAQWLILDEPTAPLSASETETLFTILRQLKSQGVGILIVSHRVEEILSLCDTVTVLRDGTKVTTVSAKEVTRDDLIRLMSPRTTGAGGTIQRTPPAFGGPLLKLENFQAVGMKEPVHLTVHRGEIVGFFGLVGSGRSEFAQAIVGLACALDGELYWKDKKGAFGNLRQALKAGIAYLPEDRLTEGIHPIRSVRENIGLSNLPKLSRWSVVNSEREKLLAKQMVESLRIRTHSLEEPVAHLSGGNQQKVSLAKWLAAQPDLLILDEPTHGVDVATKAEIHRLIRQMRDNGKGIILISSELPELMELADRILVFRDGRIVGEFRPQEGAQRIFQRALGNGDSKVETRRPIPGQRLSAFRFGREAILALFLVILVLVVGAFNRDFLLPSYWLQLLKETVPTFIVTAAIAGLIISGNLDLSVGSLLGASAMTAGLLAKAGFHPLWSVATSVVLGAAVGTINGLLTTTLQVSSVVVTLGMMGIIRGLMLFFTKGNWVTDLPDSFRWLAHGAPLGLPNNLLLAGLIAVLLIVVLKQTHWGRQIYGIGSNPEASRLAGIPVKKRVVQAFALCGALTGLAGVLSAAQFAVVQSETGKGFELAVITAAVLGGVRIFGGAGSVLGALIGALTVSVITSALTFLHLPGEWGQFFLGFLILVSLLADIISRRGIPAPRGW
ncbi:MAG: ATP-binding cassette domain-containing protein, partial [Armatimonadetes bacterium]|nr:ATP-binding cassette domain-containing protein [Armatimonadota bacterium]MDW8123055.1 ATP-binding cassette domain-containing protein [Armatimonadota bacterium]